MTEESQPQGISRLISEAQRRRVFRVMGLYAAAAFVVLQLADILWPMFGWPDNTLIWVLWGVFAVFPMVLLGSWFLEITDEGLRWDTGQLPERFRGSANWWMNGLVIFVALAVGGLYLERLLGDELTVSTEEAVDGAQILPASGSLQTEKAAESSSTTTTLDASVAVLPFSNLSASADTGYFAAGMHEDILNSLAQVPGLLVTSRTSTLRYQETDLSIPNIARELQVSYVLEGSVRRAGDQVRITVQLISANDDRHIWSNSFDRQMQDVFAMQTAVANDVAAALQEELGLTPSQTTMDPEVVDPDAYDLFIRARDRISSDSYDPQEVGAMLRAATRISPEYADPFVGLGLLAWRSGTATGREEAVRLYDKALALNPGHVNALEGKATVLGMLGRRSESEVLFKKALSINPNHFDSLRQYAFMLWFGGRLGEASALFQRMYRLNPHSSEGRYALLARSALRNEPEQVRRHLREIQAQETLDEQIMGLTAFTLAQANEFVESVALAIPYLQYFELNPQPRNLLAMMLFFCGDDKAALYWLDQAESLYAQWDLNYWLRAQIHIYRGDVAALQVLMDRWDDFDDAHPEIRVRYRATVLELRSEQARLAGDTAEAQRLNKQALSALRVFVAGLEEEGQIKTTYWSRFGLIQGAMLARRLGKDDLADRWFRAMVDNHQQLEYPDQWSVALTAVAQAGLGREAQAVALLEQLDAMRFFPTMLFDDASWGLLDEDSDLFADFARKHAHFRTRFEARQQRTLNELHERHPELFDGSID